MKISVTKRLLTAVGASLVIALAALLVISDTGSYFTGPEATADNIELETKELSKVEKKAARSEYFFKLLRDPRTNQIPENIRNRELQFAETLPTAQQAFRQAKGKNPSMQEINYNWTQGGPFDVGGRTRALAVDQRDPNIVLAGGVSGGMWKSTDGGQTWDLKTPDLPNLSVTSIAQDPTSPDTWYYASGEVLGNSASARNSAPYYGQGIYKSTDNGESWSLMPQASSNTQGFVDTFNTVSRIRVSPQGTVFISSIGRGVYRSTDGQSFNGPVVGSEGEQLFCDVAIASDGTIAAVISEAAFDDQLSESPSNNHNPGVFVSTDDGQSWTEVTPTNFPDTHRRSVLNFAPSNPDILYVFSLKGVNATSNQNVSFFHIDLGAGTAEDRSSNLPDFRTNGEGTGYVNTQGGYNMVVDVKPDDENYVFLGATNLFRSSDGFATSPSGGYDGSDESQKDTYWIGGYNQNNTPALYPNQHPDQHIIEFPQPNTNPDLMWAGHDGGLSYTTDVATTGEVSWEDRDEGYITSQFYAVDIPAQQDDQRLVGGTQDNGTPYFQNGQPNSQQSQDISSGDGGYAHFTENYVFVSSQFGRVIRWNSDFTNLEYVNPSPAENQLFIHPYEVDPNDENVMYYPEDNHIWRNTTMDQISNTSGSGTTTGWEELDNLGASAGYSITALEVSQNPGNILYLAGSSGNDNTPPQLVRVDDAKTATSGGVDISLPSQYQQNLGGAYVKDIAINPVNANEVVVVMSNYNITGLYHTTDAGDSWQAIEGNLSGTSNNPGLSLRSAAIIPAESGTIYLIGTSAGLYSTQTLNGDNTTWGQEASDNLGNAVTEHLASRVSDGDVAVGTHGRGIFVGDFQGTTDAPFVVSDPSEGRAGDTITLTANDFQFNQNATANEVTFGDMEATVLGGTTSELQVEVPRDVLDRQAESRTVVLGVDTGNESVFTNFTVLPPNTFSTSPNYPNPFNGSTTIPFDLPSEGTVTLAVYNMNGQKVLEPIWQTDYNAGTYNENIDLSGLASGVYIYRLISESGNQTYMDSRKMTLIK